MRQLNYVIFDDERVTEIYLEQTISLLRPNYIKIAGCGSVANIRNTIEFYHPDFIISGIRLSDGISTDELKRIGCQLPIVIYTSYHSYLTDLYDLNIIHSGIKPIPTEDVAIAIDKIEKYMDNHFQHDEIQFTIYPYTFTNQI